MTAVTWVKLSEAQQLALVEAHFSEYCVEAPVYYMERYGMHKSYGALLKRGLLTLDGRKLFVTPLGLSIIPSDRITYPIYKKESQS